MKIKSSRTIIISYYSITKELSQSYKTLLMRNYIRKSPKYPHDKSPKRKKQSKIKSIKKNTK